MIRAVLPPTDEELVARHLRGDPQAFAELIARYTGRVFNLAYRFTGDRAEAEDVAQESFLRAYAALPRSQTERPFKPWLFQIVVNLCRDQARRKRPVTFTDLDSADEAETAWTETIPETGLLPLEQVEANEMEAALHSALMELAEEDRLMLTLRYTEELSYEEIGQMLSLPPATVGTRLFRSKQRLRVKLKALTVLAEVVYG